MKQGSEDRRYGEGASDAGVVTKAWGSKMGRIGLYPGSLRKGNNILDAQASLG